MVNDGSEVTTRPILEQCMDPYAMRRRADRGLPVPCGRCFFEEPGIGRGCKAVNRNMKVIRPPADVPRTSPLRGGKVDVLQLVLPTADMSGGPGPESPPEKEST